MIWPVIVDLDESQRQAILLAVAKLSLSRPGWLRGCLAPLADKLQGAEMFEKFRSLGPDETPAIERLTEALFRYHHALDTHQHGGVAAGKLADDVEEILKQPWKRGATLIEKDPIQSTEAGLSGHASGRNL